MAQRFTGAIPQFLDDTGTPRVGARLFFYQSGTSTKLDTYPIAALTGSPNPNPIVLDELGESPVSIWLPNQDVKIVLAGPDATLVDDPPSNTIATWDPVRGSDFTAFSIRKIGSGDPNGVVAGTAGSASVLPTEYWDYTNSILYICTTSGTALSAVWTAINPTPAADIVPPPQGYLTATSGTPVIAADVIAGTAVYYAPDSGGLVPVYDGANFDVVPFDELTLTLAAQHAISTIYDCFVFSDSGTVRIATGPAWSNSGAGAGARGAGAGSTQLTRVSGILVNAVNITGRNGATTYSIAANRATYVGSILIDGTAGQITCHRAWGQSRKWGIWNAYNRKEIILKAGDATASWTYNTATFRASNNAAANSLTIFSGLDEELFDLTFVQFISTNSTTGGVAENGIGYNSTSAVSGKVGTMQANGASNAGSDASARHIAAPALGIQTITALEKGTGNATNTWSGAETKMMLTARYRG